MLVIIFYFIVVVLALCVVLSIDSNQPFQALGYMLIIVAMFGGKWAYGKETCTLTQCAGETRVLKCSRDYLDRPTEYRYQKFGCTEDGCWYHNAYVSESESAAMRFCK